MTIRICEIHPGDDAKKLNTEWFIIENTGDKPFSTRNCTLRVSQRGSRRHRELGTIDPGFVLAPGERRRIVTGNPGRKAQGKAPEDDVVNYNLFLAAPVLRGKGTVIALALRTHVVTKAQYDPAADHGIAAES